MCIVQNISVGVLCLAITVESKGECVKDIAIIEISELRPVNTKLTSVGIHHHDATL